MRASALALMLVAIIIAMRVLVPQGFMPTHSAQGAGVALTLCNEFGGGLLANHGDDAGSQGGDPASDRPQNPQCAFAGWYAAPAPQPAVLIEAAAWSDRELAVPSGDQSGVIRIAAAKPPATGPPVLA